MPPGPNKLYASLIAGAATTIIAYVINLMLAHPLPAEIVGALQTLITAGAVYVIPTA